MALYQGQFLTHRVWAKKPAAPPRMARMMISHRLARTSRQTSAPVSWKPAAPAIAVDAREVDQRRIRLCAVADDAVAGAAGEIDAHAEPVVERHPVERNGPVVVVVEQRAFAVERGEVIDERGFSGSGRAGDADGVARQCESGDGVGSGVRERGVGGFEQGDQARGGAAVALLAGMGPGLDFGGVIRGTHLGDGSF